jgi:hypothetical protein
MPSPQTEVFALYNATTGLPLTGQAGSMSFTTYKDDTGVNVLPVPTISEIGSTGFYKFTPTLPASADRSLIYQINTGANANPTYVARYVRPEDWYTDEVKKIRQILTNKYSISATGLNAFQLVVYDDDSTTILYKFDLKDSTGAPSIVNILSRVPA